MDPISIITTFCDVYHLKKPYLLSEEKHEIAIPKQPAQITWHQTYCWPYSSHLTGWHTNNVTGSGATKKDAKKDAYRSFTLAFQQLDNEAVMQTLKPLEDDPCPSRITHDCLCLDRHVLSKHRNSYTTTVRIFHPCNCHGCNFIPCLGPDSDPLNKLYAIYQETGGSMDSAKFYSEISKFYQHPPQKCNINCDYL